MHPIFQWEKIENFVTEKKAERWIYVHFDLLVYNKCIHRLKE